MNFTLEKRSPITGGKILWIVLNRELLHPRFSSHTLPVIAILTFCQIMAECHIWNLRSRF